MHLTLDALQKLVKKTSTEERLAGELKSEIRKILGPVVVTEGRLSEVVTAANDRLDVLDRTGRTGSLIWESRVTAKWLDHTDPEIRKFAARVVPERYLNRIAGDRNPAVRAAVAHRVPLNAVREMIKRFPKDDNLRSIFRNRKLQEAGIAKPETQPMGHDPVDGKKRMGDASRTMQVPDLTEAWYIDRAQRLVQEYGQTLDTAWEEPAVNRFCSSTKLTSGLEVDEAKLLKSLKKIIKEKEDMAMERNPLKETMGWLRTQEERELLAEGQMTDFVEVIDPVHELVNGRLSREQYIESAAHLFRIQESMLPMGIRKYRLGEGNARQTLVPCVGVLPHKSGFRALDERALDVFCEHWSKRQQQEGEPLRLEWTTHPSDVNKIGFSCTLK